MHSDAVSCCDPLGENVIWSSPQAATATTAASGKDFPRPGEDGEAKKGNTGRSCWGSGQQDVSAVQGTKRMLGAATRRQITN